MVAYIDRRLFVAGSAASAGNLLCPAPAEAALPALLSFLGRLVFSRAGGWVARKSWQMARAGSTGAARARGAAVRSTTGRSVRQMERQGFRNPRMTLAANFSDDLAEELGSWAGGRYYDHLAAHLGGGTEVVTLTAGNPSHAAGQTTYIDCSAFATAHNTPPLLETTDFIGLAYVARQLARHGHSPVALTGLLYPVEAIRQSQLDALGWHSTSARYRSPWGVVDITVRPDGDPTGTAGIVDYRVHDQIADRYL